MADKWPLKMCKKKRVRNQLNVEGAECACQLIPVNGGRPVGGGVVKQHSPGLWKQWYFGILGRKKEVNF